MIELGYFPKVVKIDNYNQLRFKNIWNYKQNGEQAGAELCQAQVKLEVIVDVVEEAWS